MDCIIDLFTKYQTFIVGFLGFAGVIYTIEMNAKLAKEQHERELTNESEAIRTALVVELNGLKESYKDRINMFDDGIHNEAALIPEYVSDKIYHQLLPRLGLLTSKEIKSVMEAYQLVGELPIRLNLLSTESNNRSGYIEIDNSKITVMIKMHRNFLKNIDSALLALSENTKN